MTLAEAQAQLTTINAALSDIIAGKRLTQLTIGSGHQRRDYKYAEITAELLRELQKEYLAIVNDLTVQTPIFRTNATIPLVVSKDYRRVIR